jgi:hypothetical protein
LSKKIKEQIPVSRKDYLAPKLTYFGAIKDLTSGGTGGPEMGKGKMKLTRRA